MISKKRIVGILCLLMAEGLLFVGLWPFDTSPRNRAYWIPNEDGLNFDGQNRRWKLSVGGIAYTPSPLRSQKSDPPEKGSFTIDILLKPARERTSGVPHILGFVDSSEKEVFYLGQWKESLIVRWYTHDQSGRRRMKEIGVRDALPKDKVQRLTLVSKRTACNVYVNGELAKSFHDMSLIGERDSIRGGSVVLGNSRSVKGPWTGAVLALTVHERALDESEIARGLGGAGEGASPDGLVASYTMDKSCRTSIPDLSGNKNTLEVPERVTLGNSILDWPDWRNQKNSSPAGDIAVNVLGFVPFGFFLTFWLQETGRSKRWHSYLLVIFAGGLISLVIEVVQAFIPARDSSLADVACNALGTILGVAAFGSLSLSSLGSQCLKILDQNKGRIETATKA